MICTRCKIDKPDGRFRGRNKQASEEREIWCRSCEYEFHSSSNLLADDKVRSQDDSESTEQGREQPLVRPAKAELDVCPRQNPGYMIHYPDKRE